MKYPLITLCSLLLLLSSPLLQAETNVYAGGTVGFASFDYDDVDPSTSTELIIGFGITDNFAIEASLYDSGDADITSLPSVTIATDGTNVSVLYRVDNSKNKITGFFGAGYYSFDSTLEGPGGSVSIDTSGLSLIVGLHYAIAEHFALRGDANYFSGVDDFADNNDVMSFQVGGVFLF